MSRAAIFYHGFLTDDNDFGNLTDYVGKYYDECVKYVFPGHKKPNDFSKFTAEESLRDSLAAFDRLRERHDEIDVYGFSMGGAVATRIAKMREVKRLILLAPANKYINVKSVFEQFRYNLRIAVRLLEEPSKEKYKETKKAFDIYFANDRKGWAIAAKQLFPNYTYHNLTTFAKIIKKCNEGLTKLRPKTLIIWGKLDQFVPYESVLFLSDMFENAESKVKIYDDLSHLMLYGENAQEVIDEIVDFVK